LNKNIIFGTINPTGGSMTLIDMIKQGNSFGLVIMGIIIVGILAMIIFFNNELKKSYQEKKNDQPVASNIQRTGNDAVTAAISAAVNEYGKNK
jgi:CHASE3 domain sensor protein